MKAQGTVSVVRTPTKPRAVTGTVVKHERRAPSSITRFLNSDAVTVLRRRKVNEPNQRAAQVFAVIPAYHEADTLAAVLDSIYAQTRQVDAVIVVPNERGKECTDDTELIARRYAQKHRDLHVSTLYQNSNGKVGALNHAWHQVVDEADYLLGVDGDTVLDPRCVEHLLEEALSDPRIGGISALYGFDQSQAKNPMEGFLLRSQRFQFAGFTMDNLLRNRNMVVLGGQCSLLSVYALEKVCEANHQAAPWTNDSEVEDSLLSIQLRQAGFLTKISATARANVGPMLTLRALSAQQRKWITGGTELMLKYFFQRKANLALRWKEAASMFTNILVRIALILLVIGSLSLGGMTFQAWWLIPPVAAALMNLRVALSMKKHSSMDVVYALTLIGPEVFLWIRASHSVSSWVAVASKLQRDMWAAQADAESGKRDSMSWLFPACVASAFAFGVYYAWQATPSALQHGIVNAGWAWLGLLTIVQTVFVARKALRRHRGFLA